MKNKEILKKILIAVILIGVGFLFGFFFKNENKKISNYDKTPLVEMKASGNVEDLVSFSITPGQEVKGKMEVTGSIKGGYFFEGNLPVKILDANKEPTIYGPGHGQASTEWMTSGPVSFSIDFDFTEIPKGEYYIKITQDDPRDESERGDYKIKEILIPIVIN